MVCRGRRGERLKVSGEAVVVEIGPGKLLFARLSGPKNKRDAMGLSGLPTVRGPELQG